MRFSCALAVASLLLAPLTLFGQCAPLAWQLRVGAEHVRALRVKPLPAGGSRSPPSPAGTTRRARPILGDPLAHALTLDALTHPGPAVPARLPADVCSGTLIPGFDPTLAPLFLVSVARFAPASSTRPAGSPPSPPSRRTPSAGPAGPVVGRSSDARRLASGP